MCVFVDGACGTQGNNVHAHLAGLIPNPQQSSPQVCMLLFCLDALRTTVCISAVFDFYYVDGSGTEAVDWIRHSAGRLLLLLS